jgi:hypothetical protein
MRANSFGNIYRPHTRSVTVIDGPAFDPALTSTLPCLDKPFRVQLEEETPESRAFAGTIASRPITIRSDRQGQRCDEPQVRGEIDVTGHPARAVCPVARLQRLIYAL